MRYWDGHPEVETGPHTHPVSHNAVQGSNMFASLYNFTSENVDRQYGKMLFNLSP
jgi:hypothetical protein